MKKSLAPRIAYFSMEIALEPDIPTYSGGLGILAGDTLRSAADLGTPVSLFHRQGALRLPSRHDVGGILDGSWQGTQRIGIRCYTVQFPCLDSVK